MFKEVYFWDAIAMIAKIEQIVKTVVKNTVQTLVEKMKKTAIYFLFALAITFGPACKKTTPAEAIVTVKDVQGNIVSGARVVLRQDSVVNSTTGVRADVFQEQTTSSTGEAFFSFELEAVLNCEITKGAITNNDEYVRLEQNETVRKTIVLD